MKPTLIFALFAMSTVAVFPAQAQTYQWKDSSGRTVISDTPQPGAGKASRPVSGAPAVAVESAGATSEKVADEPKTTAEKNMEFKKRQQEAKEKAEKTAKEQAAAAEKQDNCRRAQQNLAGLQSGRPMATLDANGQQVVMDTSQRDQEMERAYRIMTESCK